MSTLDDAILFNAFILMSVIYIYNVCDGRNKYNP